MEDHLTYQVTLVNMTSDCTDLPFDPAADPSTGGKADGCGTILPNRKPSLCYLPSQFTTCIDTNGPFSWNLPDGLDIDCEYLKDGNWVSKDPTEASPFIVDQCNDYSVCLFEQTWLNGLVVSDKYWLMCNQCREGFSGGVTNVVLGSNFEKGFCSATQTESYFGRPSKCYSEETGFNNCPGDATSAVNYNGDPTNRLERCKYMYQDTWNNVPVVSLSEDSVR